MLNLLKLLHSLPPQRHAAFELINVQCAGVTGGHPVLSTPRLDCFVRALKPLLQFTDLQRRYYVQNSKCLAFSCLAFSVSCYFMSGNFSPAISYPTIPCLSFSALPLHAIGCVRLTRRQDAPTVQQITGTSSNWSIDFIFLIFPLFSVSENVTLVCPPLTFAGVECKAIFYKNTCT